MPAWVETVPSLTFAAYLALALTCTSSTCSFVTCSFVTCSFMTCSFMICFFLPRTFLSRTFLPCTFLPCAFIDCTFPIYRSCLPLLWRMIVASSCNCWNVPHQVPRKCFTCYKAHPICVASTFTPTARTYNHCSSAFLKRICFTRVALVGCLTCSLSPLPVSKQQLSYFCQALHQHVHAPSSLLHSTFLACAQHLPGFCVALSTHTHGAFSDSASCLPRIDIVPSSPPHRAFPHLYCAYLESTSSLPHKKSYFLHRTYLALNLPMALHRANLDDDIPRAGAS